MKKWLQDHMPTRRRLIQIYAALLYNAHLKGFIEGTIYTGNAKALCVPGLNCYSCPAATASCPLGALQNAIASSGSRAPTYILGVLMLYGLILGRTVCGFLCPFGLVQELLHHIPTPKVKKGRITRSLSYLKYIVLVLFVILIPLLGVFQADPLPAFCKYICPAGTAEGAIGLLAHPANDDMFPMLGNLFTNKFVILMIIMDLCVFIYRAFCRFLCPLGAIYGVFSKFAIIGVKVDQTKCIDCNRCIQHCKMDIRHVSDHECIHCGSCIDVCPIQAISYKAGRITLYNPDKKINKVTPQRRERHSGICLIALTILVGSLLYYNLPMFEADFAIATPKTEGVEINNNTEMSTLAVGNEVGMLGPDFSVHVYGSERPYVLSEQRGKKVVMNFWATWCGPCCKELPYFDDIHQKYGETVSVIAIHSDLVTEDVEGYLAEYHYQMPFAYDATGSVIKAYGGSNMLPHTIILNELGIVTYNAPGSLTFDKLEVLLGVAQDQ